MLHPCLCPILVNLVQIVGTNLRPLALLIILFMVLCVLVQFLLILIFAKIWRCDPTSLEINFEDFVNRGSLLCLLLALEMIIQHLRRALRRHKLKQVVMESAPVLL